MEDFGRKSNVLDVNGSVCMFAYAFSYVWPNPEDVYEYGSLNSLYCPIND